MNHAFSPSPFTSLAAVEAWDAWFRWRDRDGLHDTAIEDTWWRVASALSPPADHVARQRLFEAMARWQLLPDELTLAVAGTPHPAWNARPRHAVVNIAACLHEGAPQAPTIDLDAVRRITMLALHALEPAAAQPPCARRIGIVGLADALALGRLRYDSDAARQQAAAVARTMAEACRQLGPAATCASGPAGGVVDGPALTLAPHPRLALLANDVADGLAPLMPPGHVHVIGDGPQASRIQAAGFAMTRLRAAGAALADIDHRGPLPPGAEPRMRAAVMPWLRRAGRSAGTVAARREGNPPTTGAAHLLADKADGWTSI